MKKLFEQWQRFINEEIDYKQELKNILKVVRRKSPIDEELLQDLSVAMESISEHLPIKTWGFAAYLLAGKARNVGLMDVISQYKWPEGNWPHLNSDGLKIFRNIKTGEINREDGPAISHKDGYEEYYRDGRLHRDNNKPAVIYPGPTGTREYYYLGKLHRTNGPAVVYHGGPGEFYIHGQKLSPKKWKKMVRKSLEK